MDKRLIKSLTLLLVVATGAFGAETKKTPVTFDSGSSLTIKTGVHVSFLAGSYVDATGANLVGFNFQPLDPDLTYLAGVALSANVKAILNAADFPAVRSLMGLGTMALQADTGTRTGIQIANGTGGLRDATSVEAAHFTDLGYNFVPYFITGTVWDELRLDTDGTLAANSATRLATQNAVKTYADGKVSNLPYNATTWNGVTGVAPSQDAVRDALEAAVVGAGSGTVTHVMVGSLSPLFSVAVTNPDSTPDAEFTLSTAGALTFYGNPTVSDATPVFMSVSQALTALGLSSTNNPSFGNVYIRTTTLVYAATTTIDFAGDGWKTLALTGNVTFASSNLFAGRSKTIKILCDGTDRTLAFPAGWIFLGNAAPTSIAANKTAILTLTSWSTTDASVVAQYVVQP